MNMSFLLGLIGQRPPYCGQGCFQTIEALVLHGADVNAADHSVDNLSMLGHMSP